MHYIITLLNFWTWAGWQTLGAMATMVAAIATILYTFFTYKLLASSQISIAVANENRAVTNKLAEFQIYMKITEQLVTDKAFELLELIADDDFIIVEARRAELQNEQHFILESDLRRYILNPLEDLAKFHDDGLVTMSSIDSGFGNTILQVGSSNQIAQYITSARLKDRGIYEGVESLYRKERGLLTEEERSRYPDHFTIGNKPL